MDESLTLGDTDLRAPADDDDETEATASVANDPEARARASRALAARMVRGLDLSLDAEYSRRRSERQKAKLSSPRLPQLPPANRLECGRAAFEMTPPFGQLEPWGMTAVVVSLHNNMWGLYEDKLIVEIGGLQPVA